MIQTMLRVSFSFLVLFLNNNSTWANVVAIGEVVERKYENGTASYLINIDDVLYGESTLGGLVVSREESRIKLDTEMAGTTIFYLFGNQGAQSISGMVSIDEIARPEYSNRMLCNVYRYMLSSELENQAKKYNLNFSGELFLTFSNGTIEINAGDISENEKYLFEYYSDYFLKRLEPYFSFMGGGEFMKYNSKGKKVNILKINTLNKTILNIRKVSESEKIN